MLCTQIQNPTSILLVDLPTLATAGSSPIASKLCSTYASGCQPSPARTMHQKLSNSRSQDKTQHLNTTALLVAQYCPVASCAAAFLQHVRPTLFTACMRHSSDNLHSSFQEPMAHKRLDKCDLHKDYSFTLQPFWIERDGL